MRSIEAVWRTQTRIGRARLVGVAGALSTFASAGFYALVWLMELVLSAFFPAQIDNSWGKLPEALAIDVLLALLALLGVLLYRWPPISALVLLVASAGSIVWGLGWYFLLTPSPLFLAGLGGVLYLVAAAMMVHAVLTPWDRRRAAN